MNPYAVLAHTANHEQERLFLEQLRAWHDEMVLHQRTVRRVGRREACSDDCPHAQGRRLWTEARALFGPGADRLTFLRACAVDSAARLHGS